MNYLLDAHSILWYTLNDDRLPVQQYRNIENSSNQIFISYVSIWEIGIKNSIGKLKIEKSFESFVKEKLEPYNFIFLSIQLSHVIEATSLPFHHRDPFDRMLIAQSKIENIPVISSDSVFDKYGVTRVW